MACGLGHTDACSHIPGSVVEKMPPKQRKGNLFFYSLPNRICDGSSGETSRPRVAANIAKYKLFEDPISVEPEAIGADWVNRMGSTHIMVCHQVLVESFNKDGLRPIVTSMWIVQVFCGKPRTS